MEPETHIEVDDDLDERQTPEDERHIPDTPRCNPFEVGYKFYSIEDLNTKIAEFEEENHCQLWKRDARTLTAAQKRVPKRVENANKNLEYYSMRLTCKFGGKEHKASENAQRVSRSFRQNCPFDVNIVLSIDGQSLEVSKSNLLHNHDVSSAVYNHLPRQRNVKGALKDTVKEALALKANHKLIQQKIQKETGKFITLKDISNLKAETQQTLKSNNLQEVVPFLASKSDDVTVEVAVDDNGNFQCLFFQDGRMKTVYKNYPEIILCDSTYKLLDLQLPVFIIMAIDGYGLSEVVAVFITCDETEEPLTAAIDFLQKNNPDWPKTKVILTDKDMQERNIFSKKFPCAALQLCLYHVHKSFRREVTKEKMGISSGQREQVLEVIVAISYSKTVKEFETNVTKLKKMNISSVNGYFETCWESIKEEWVSCFKSSTFCLGETTTNRLESFNSKIKNVCSRRGTLLQFFSSFLDLLAALRNERDHSRLMMRFRKTAAEIQDVDFGSFRDLFTPFATKLIKMEDDKSQRISGSENANNDTVAENVNKDTAGENVVKEVPVMGDPAISGEFSLCLSATEGSTIDPATTGGSTANPVATGGSTANPAATGGFTADPATTVEFTADPAVIGGSQAIAAAENNVKDTTVIDGSRCSCGHFQMFGLPCRHIFRERRALGLPKFCPELVHPRWLLEKDITEGTLSHNLPKSSSFPGLEKPDVERVTIIESQKPGTILSEAQKYKKSLKLAQSLASAAAEGGMSSYEDRVNDMKKLISKWRNEDDNVPTNLNPDDAFKTILSRHVKSKTFKDAETNTEDLEKEAGYNLGEGVDHQAMEPEVSVVEDESLPVPSLGSIKMPPKKTRKGRPRGCDSTVIGLPRSKHSKADKPVPFEKLGASEKDVAILRCFVSDEVAHEAVNGDGRLISSYALKSNIHHIPDLVRDSSAVSVSRVEKYFDSEAWGNVQDLVKLKSSSKFECPRCLNCISDEAEDSICCDKCMSWFHFQCTNLKKSPKSKYWFCRACKAV